MAHGDLHVTRNHDTGKTTVHREWQSMTLGIDLADLMVAAERDDGRPVGGPAEVRTELVDVTPSQPGHPRLSGDDDLRPK